MTKTNFIFVSLMAVMTSASVFAATPATNNYGFKLETDIKGYKHQTQSFNISDSGTPGATFFATDDGAYVFQFAAKEGELNGKKGTVITVISGLMPDPKSGSNLASQQFVLGAGDKSFHLTGNGADKKAPIKMEVFVSHVDAPVAK